MDFTDLPDDELWLQMQDDLYDGMKAEVADETNEALRRGYTPVRSIGQGPGGGHGHCGRGLPRWRAVCAGGADGGQRHEGWHGNFAPAAGRTPARRASARW